jgi:hypothetical protein
MGKKFLISIAALLLTCSAMQCLASGEHFFQIDKDDTINTTITNTPLQEVLKNFCSTFDLDLRGTVAGEETITLSIANGTFDETLRGLMRGYNYVLLREATLNRYSIMLLGKVERSKYSEEPAARSASESPVYGQPAAPTMQRGLSPSSQPAASSVISSGSSPNPTAVERQKQFDEEKSGVAAASVRPVRAQSQTSSTTPPAPPSVSGLELPPMPPTLEQAKGTQTHSLTGEDSSRSQALDKPPEIPEERHQSSTIDVQPKPKLDLRDLTPPSMPNG